MLREELLAQAKHEAAMIREEAKEKARAIVQQAQEKKQQEREQAEREYEKEKERLDNKRYAQAQARAKKRSLEAQARAIKELTNKAHEKLENETTYKKLFKMAKSVVQPKKVYCNKDYQAAIPKLANVQVTEIDGIRLENENESVTITITDLIEQVVEEKEDVIIRSLRSL